MWEDPIVAEVHRIRQELAARFDYDIDAMFADMRERQASLGPRLVSLAGNTVGSDRERPAEKAEPITPVLA